MNATDIQDYVLEYFAERGIPAKPYSTFKDMRIDSLSLVEFVMHLEDKFHVEINADEIDDSGNIAQFSGLVARAINAVGRKK